MIDLRLRRIRQGRSLESSLWGPKRWSSVRPISISVLAALWLEEPEQPIFAHVGKSDRFAEARQSPAVLVFYFRRLGSADGAKGAL